MEGPDPTVRTTTGATRSMRATSAIPTAAWLTEACAAVGIHHAVISPGSRNAPLIIAFDLHPDIQCFSVPDERAAGFFALGMAQQLGSPVALICTSGSAVLNYAPCCVEAFYQHVPILVLSADRPAELIDVGDGQTIRQVGSLEPHVKRTEVFDRVEKEDRDRLISALLCLTEAPSGPVHVNVPFAEPLYGTCPVEQHAFDNITLPPSRSVEPDPSDLERVISSAEKILVLAGQMPPNTTNAAHLALFAARTQAMLLSECTSNVDQVPSIGSIDRVLPLVDEEHRPDLLITVGNAIVSKRIKAWLRSIEGLRHWHMGSDPMDTFGRLQGSVNTDDLSILDTIDTEGKNRAAFVDHWKRVGTRAQKEHEAFLASAPYCDLSVFDALLQNIPAGSDIHLANSTPVRYAQLFDRGVGHRYFSNRGTSGIDGCTSTAVGAAWATDRLTTLITGDVSFLYDSNGLWHEHLSQALRIIVIDNGGGNIFRFIEGPDATDRLGYFETPHHLDVSMLAEAFGLPTYICQDHQDLMSTLPKFYTPHRRPPVLVIRTDPQVGPQVLREYFQHLGQR